MYASKQDMIDRYGVNALVQTTDLSTPQIGEVVDKVLTARLLDASCEIDSYLAGRTVVPMVTPPHHIKGICCLLTMSKLLGDAQSDAMRADVRSAREYLAGVAKGAIQFGSGTDLPAPQGAGSVHIDPGTKHWGREL